MVTYPSGAERSLPRAVYPTVPYPLRAGSRALFGVAFANGGEKTVVTQVDVEVPGGYDVWRNDGEGAELFAPGEILRPSDQDGAWAWVDAKHLRWTGARVVEALGASSWTFGVLVTGDVGEATSVEPPRSDGPEGRLRFGNGYEHRSARWGAVPGVVRHEVPAASGPDEADGYPWARVAASGSGPASGGGPGARPGTDVGAHEVEVRTVEATLVGAASYEVSPAAGDLLRLRSGLANSSFAVRERKVPVGGVLQSDADFESVVNELGRMGVADTTLTMELFAPPSRGCEPTATWSRDSRSLPLARVRDLLLWDATGLGVNDLFLVAEDGQAYRVNHAGSPLWSVPVPHGDGVRLAAGEFGPADRRLFAATEGGHLLRLDPATGALVWSAPVAQGAGTLDGVSALLVQPGQGRVLVGTRLGAVVPVDAETGAVLPGALVVEGGAVVQLEPLPGAGPQEAQGGGGVVAAHAGGVRVLAPDLSVVASWSVGPGGGSVVGVAAAPGSASGALGRLLVATSGRTLDLSLPDLAPGKGGFAHAGEALLAAPGDATGDGVRDLVVALKDAGVVAVSGATGGVAWTHAGGPVADVGPSPVPFGALDPWRATGKGHLCRKVAATYQNAHELCEWDARRDQSEPLLLRVGRERVYYAHVGHGNPYLDGLDREGRLVARAFLAQVPDALAAGEWTPGAGEGVMVAGAEGTVEAYEGARWDAPTFQARPTDFVGRFTFFTPVPGGGFFGTHLLVATLGWTEQGVAREARLFDWFEVVGPDGKPVLEPTYRVVLVVQDRGDPLER